MDKNGFVSIQDMWLHPDQMPAGLRQKFEDCERRGLNTHVGGQDQCFTVKKSGNGLAVKIQDMWLVPQQQPPDLRKKVEDCERRGLNKHVGENKVKGGERNNFWPDYVWRKGGGK